MSETTPGPWEINLDLDAPHWPAIPIKAMQGPIDVCPAQAYSLADAHLIAAAPDMYEALKAITDCYGVGSSAEKFVEHVHEFMMEGRRALSKARGEPS